MALSATDIWRLEVTLRIDADKMRKDWPDNPSDSEPLRQHGVIMRGKAAAYESVADLLLAMQADWPGFSPQLRTAYQIMCKRSAPTRPETEEVEAA